LRKHGKEERKICVCARLIYLGTPKKWGREGKEGKEKAGLPNGL
jgi:hypothetical protein